MTKEKYYHNGKLFNTEKEFDDYRNQLEKERFEKAEKIEYKDWDGLVDTDEPSAADEDALSEWIMDFFDRGDDPPEYVWAMKKEKAFTLDIKEYILDQCERNGYEEMDEMIDLKSPILNQVQELLRKWEEEQGDVIYNYHTDYTKAILLKDFNEETKKEWEDIKSYDYYDTHEY